MQYACRLYGKAFTFSGSKDTIESIKQALRKNATFRAAGCKI